MPESIATEKHVNVKGTKRSRHMLKLLAAHTQKTQYEALERLLEQEIKRLGIKIS